MRFIQLSLLFPTLLVLTPLWAQQVPPGDAILAPTPPMGWNSWDSFGLTVTESEFNANAAWLAKHLKRYGWNYAVVDEGWYLSNPEVKPANPAAKTGRFHFVLDENGRYTPAVNRFPSAANGNGFTSLAERTHALGLKFGIHIIRGIPKEAVDGNLPIANSSYHAAEAADKSDTCPWNADNYGVRATPAGQAYYDSIAKLYAGWGVDFVKIDCIAANPYKGDEIRMFSQALRKTGRPIVLSLSPGPAPLDKAQELRKYAQMWRISGDVWDHWGPTPNMNWSQSLSGQFPVAASWAPFITAGHWPDADMLPIGHLGPRPGEGPDRLTKLTKDEQRTLLTLWSIFRSPLIMGGNLTLMDPWTTSLLTNEEVIAVDQRSTGNHPIKRDKGIVWVAQAEAGEYVAVFNLQENAQHLEYKWSDIGLNGRTYNVRDLWEHKDLGKKDQLEVTLSPHASVLYLVSADNSHGAPPL